MVFPAEGSQRTLAVGPSQQKPWSTKRVQTWKGSGAFRIFQAVTVTCCPAETCASRQKWTLFTLQRRRLCQAYCGLCSKACTYTDALAGGCRRGLMKGGDVRKLSTMRRGMCHRCIHAEKTANVSNGRDDGKLNEKPGGGCFPHCCSCGIGADWPAPGISFSVKTD